MPASTNTNTMVTEILKKLFLATFSNYYMNILTGLSSSQAVLTAKAVKG